MTAPDKCQRCDGTGRVWFDDAQLSDMKYQAKCPDCEGKAPKIVAPDKCPKCGDKTVPKNTESTVTFYFCGSDYDKVFWQSTKCTVRERDALRAANAEREARLAGMVDREVAERACQMAWGHGRLRFAGAGFCEHPVDPKRIWTNGTEADNEGEYREACECAAVVLARAEAEAAKPQTDKEPDNG